MLRKLFSRKQPLTGAPETPRMKVYTASSGYVYHYFYEGRRQSRSASEYVFKLSADRARWRWAGIVMPDGAIAAWQSRNGRELSSSERYAIAKLRLFEVFDECAVPEAIPDAARVEEASIDRVAETLGWE